jgi:hypothetical protein
LIISKDVLYRQQDEFPLASAGKERYNNFDFGEETVTVGERNSGQGNAVMDWKPHGKDVHTKFSSGVRRPGALYPQ